MKFQLMFKTPDVLDQIEDVLNEVSDDNDDDDGESTDDAVKARELVDRFVEYGESLRVEFDTEKGTCVAIPHN